MRIELLVVPDCPNRTLALDRVSQAVIESGRDDVTVSERVVSDAEEAQQAGMLGSPTVLVDGRDPFADPGQHPSLSCRLYPDGPALAGAPPVQALLEVLRR